MSTARAILVLGTHRSGTSAVAGSLHRCGLSFGERLLPADARNEGGYFEDTELLSLHDEVLAVFGRTWHDPRELPSGWLDAEAVQRAAERIAAALRRRLAAAPAFGVKDPRLCLLLPLYRRILAELGAAPHCLLVLRHPGEVARSLAERDGFPAGKADLLWLRDVLLAEAATRDLPRRFVRLHALLSDWEAELLPALAAVGVGPGDAGRRRAVAAGLRPELRHHRCELPPAHPWLAAAHAALERLAAQPADAAARAELDRVRAAWQDAAPLFAPAIGDLAGRLERAQLALGFANGETARAGADAAITDRLQAAVDDRVRAQQDELRRQGAELAAARAAQAAAEALCREAIERAEDAAAGQREHSRREAALRADGARLQGELAALRADGARRQGELAALRAEAERRQGELAAAHAARQWLEAAYRATVTSWSWRATALPRTALDAARGLFARAARLGRLVTRQRVRAALALVRGGRFKEAWLQARSVATLELRHAGAPPGPGGFAPPPPADRYELHREHNRLTPRRRRDLEQRLAAAAAALPKLSVVVPVHEPPRGFLREAVRSVQEQVLRDWELVLCDDASPSADVAPLLLELAAGDARIRVVRRPQNGGIAAATNTAADAATGDFLVFLDQDDVLAADALAEIALAAAAPDVDVVYSDDDKIDASGRHFAPQFKPDYSPELLLSFSYFSHAFAVRRATFAEIGGARAEFDGAQDHDLMLRAAERARRVEHVPRVLYSWRAHAGSTARDGRQKPASLEAGRRAVAAAFARRGVDVPVRVAPWAAAIGCGIYEPCFPDTGPRVAVLIPSRDRAELLQRCVTSIEERTRYDNYELVLIDNGSTEPASCRYFARSPHRVLRIGDPRAGRDGFSYAAVNNRAAEQVDAEVLLFLNNDTEVLAPGWLSQMVGYLGLPGVGAVGARLLLPDGRLQHAGIVQGLYERMAGPAFKLQPAWDGGHLALAKVARDCSAVTAAALLVRRQTFRDLGGFDEEQFAVAFNDVDFCHRLRATGRRVVYCPGAELVHVEGGTRGTDGDHPAEEAAFRERYWRLGDPYYNPNLSLDDERFEVRAAALPLRPGRPIRTAMVGFNLNAEGSANSQLELALALRARGVVEPVVVSPDDGPLRREYEREGVEVAVVEHPLRNVHDPEFLAERLAGFAQRLRGLGAEVVHANTLQTFYAVLAAGEAGLPAVWNVRESEGWRHYFDYLAPPLRPVALAAFAAAYAVVFVSARTRDAYAELDSRRSFRLIRNGLDPARAARRLAAVDRAAARAGLGAAPGDVVLLLLGTVCERKGQADAVAAFARLPDAVAARCRLLIVGDRPGAYSDHLHALVARLPPARRARVRVERERADVATPFHAADVFVSASHSESYPRVVLEAMHVGLPVVATPVFGVLEQVREHVNALLFPPGDVERLAQQLQRLVADEPLRAALARRSPAVLRALPGFAQMVAGYAAVFEEAWATGGGP